jgi:hypothetical protein
LRNRGGARCPDDAVPTTCSRCSSRREDALKKLREIAEHDESERARNAAKQALRGR